MGAGEGEGERGPRQEAGFLGEVTALPWLGIYSPSCRDRAASPGVSPGLRGRRQPFSLWWSQEPKKQAQGFGRFSFSFPRNFMALDFLQIAKRVRRKAGNKVEKE